MPGNARSRLQKTAQRGIEGTVSADQRVIHTQVARDVFCLIEEFGELATIGGRDGTWIGLLLDKLLHTDETRRLLEWKLLFGRIDDLQNADIMTSISEVLQTGEQ